MHPELFEIPFIHLTVKSYGLMVVIGFLAALSLIRHLSRNITPNSQVITNAALYSLIAGVAGARLFYVVHYFDSKFKGDLLSIFAIWQGGLELLGGVFLAVVVILIYLRRHKLPIRRCLDIFVIALMLGLTFGRIGCFLNGCCFGKPANLPWAVRFPYGSIAYHSQVSPNLERNRILPQLELPPDFFSYVEEDGLVYRSLKPYESLTEEQKYLVDKSKYRSLPVHPTQLYSSAYGAFLCFILYLYWRRSQNADKFPNLRRAFAKPGCTFGLMCILYGIGRFFMEFLRDDNPIEFDGITISQNISIVLIVLGVASMIIFEKMKPGKIMPANPK